MSKLLAFFLVFLIDVRITIAKELDAAREPQSQLNIEKKSTPIQLSTVRREPQKKSFHKNDRRRVVLKIESETNQEKSERSEIESRRKNKNINDDVDSDFFSGTELSSRGPDSLPEEPRAAIAETIKTKFVNRLKAHWVSLKKFLFE